MVLAPSRVTGKQRTDHVAPTASCSPPDDILFELFRLVLTGNDTEFLPYKLSHVCQKWRGIFAGSPLLWSNVVICVDYKRLSPGHLLLLKHALFMSGQCPLSLRIHSTREFINEEKEELLVPHIHRIQDLVLIGTKYYYQVTNLVLDLQQPFACLKRLTVYTPNSCCIDLSRSSADLLNTPIANRNKRNSLALLLYPNLTSLSIDLRSISINVSDLCLALIATAHSLQALEIKGSTQSVLHNTELTGNEESWPFPALKRLTFQFEDDMLPFLQIIYAPNLEVLVARDRVCLGDKPYNFGVSHNVLQGIHSPTINPSRFFRIVEQHWPAIRDLRLYGLGNPSDSMVLVRCMQCLPLLESLHIYGLEAESMAFAKVFSPEIDYRILPRLKTLACSYINVGDRFLEATSRRKALGIPQLETLAVPRDFFTRALRSGPGLVNLNRVGELAKNVLIWSEPSTTNGAAQTIQSLLELPSPEDDF